MAGEAMEGVGAPHLSFISASDPGLPPAGFPGEARASQRVWPCLVALVLTQCTGRCCFSLRAHCMLQQCMAYLACLTVANVADRLCFADRDGWGGRGGDGWRGDRGGDGGWDGDR